MRRCSVQFVLVPRKRTPPPPPVKRLPSPPRRAREPERERERDRDRGRERRDRCHPDVFLNCSGPLAMVSGVFLPVAQIKLPKLDP